MDKLNLALFSCKEKNIKQNTTTLCWEEMREIHQLVLSFESILETVNLADLKIAYWRKVLPQSRITQKDTKKGIVGSVGWQLMDEWFNGGWQQADISYEVEGSKIIIGFATLGENEFPELLDE